MGISDVEDLKYADERHQCSPHFLNTNEKKIREH